MSDYQEPTEQMGEQARSEYKKTMEQDARRLRKHTTP